MASVSTVRAREAFALRDWREAHAAFATASREAPLGLEDLERYATAAHLFGRRAESNEVLAQGYRDALADGDRRYAA